MVQWFFTKAYIFVIFVRKESKSFSLQYLDLEKPFITLYPEKKSGCYFKKSFLQDFLPVFRVIFLIFYQCKKYNSVIAFKFRFGFINLKIFFRVIACPYNSF